MKIQSLFFMLTNFLVRDEFSPIPSQEKFMRPLSSDEIAVVAGGPEIENNPPPT